MPRIKRILVLLVVLVVCGGCDQATKSIAQQTMSGKPAQTLAAGIVRLEYTENPGAFLSLGAKLSDDARFWIFTVMVAALLIGLLVFAFRMSPLTPFLIILAIALVVGGGLSNLIDRLLNEGRVIDFVQLGIGPLRTGVFNVADVAIMGGLAVMLIVVFRDGKTAK